MLMRLKQFGRASSYCSRNFQTDAIPTEVSAKEGAVLQVGISKLVSKGLGFISRCSASEDIVDLKNIFKLFLTQFPGV